MISKQKKISSITKTGATLVAIPVFNEIKYVSMVLEAISGYSEYILVVNDGSTDGTTAALQKYNNIDILHHDINLGYGQSLIDAFIYAFENKYDWIITIDCDYQHEPSYIPRFYDEIRKDSADIISGSRYLNSFVNNNEPPPERLAINAGITGILNQHLSIGITDAFCGFKAYRTSCLNRLHLTEKGYGLPLQLWILAARAHYKISEISVPLIYHDPKRKFCGELENPYKRYSYYIDIIQRELGYNLDRNTKELFLPETKINYINKA